MRVAIPRKRKLLVAKQSIVPSRITAHAAISNLMSPLLDLFFEIIEVREKIRSPATPAINAIVEGITFDVNKFISLCSNNFWLILLF